MTLRHWLSRGGVLGCAIAVSGCIAPVAAGPTPVRPTTVAAAPADPCRGSLLDLDAIASKCAVKGNPRPPELAALRIELSPSEVSVRAGAKPAMAVKMTNLTATPLELDLTLGCSAFDGTAHLGATTARADEEFGEGCGDSFGGLCGTGDTIRVTLEAGGALTKSVNFTASFTRWEVKKYAQLSVCSPTLGRPLTPARYRLHVTLPFRGRTLDGTVIVLP